jgi:type II secretory pathway pseudopilin PulG
MVAIARHRRFRTQPLLSRAAAGGFTIVEPLILAILLSIVVSGTAVVLTSINRSLVESRRLVTMNEDIDSNLAEIKLLSSRLTCCSSVCTVTLLTATSTTCATITPTDSRYFFPQADNPATTATIAGTNPATADERAAVDQLCASRAFMTPLLTAVNATPLPVGVTRDSSIQANSTIRVIYTDTVNSRVTRVANVTPAMARWCP